MTVNMDSASQSEVSPFLFDGSGKSTVDPSPSLQEAQDILLVMKRQESSTYRRSDYLAVQSDLANEVVDGSWRQRIIEWMYGVVDHCNLRRDSVAIAAYYLDHSLMKGLVVSRRDFQLVAMTALQLAIKLYDSTSVKLDSMVKLGRGLFSEADVVEMEVKMLRTLNWNVHPPTPVCFLRQFIRILPANIAPLARYMIAEVTRFISEISVCLYKFVKYPPSVIAFSGMLIAMERIDDITLPLWQRQQILFHMASLAGMESTSPMVLSAVQELHCSLEKNINLEELMSTIDAQCQDGYSKMGSIRSDYYQCGGNQSPRDVIRSKFTHSGM